MISRRRALLVVALLLLAALAIRLVNLDSQDIWWDEARNIDVALRDMPDIAPSPELDIHPPVYFYFLHGWMRLTGGSPFAIRLLSVLFGLPTVAVLYQLGRAAGGRMAGVTSALIGALAPFAIGEAQEARMYTMGLAWVSLAGWFLWRAIRSGASRQWREWVGYSLFSALSILTHYSAVFVVGAFAVYFGLVWVTAPRGRRFNLGMGGALSGTAIVLLFLPQAAIAFRQVPGYRNPNLTVPGLPEYLERCLQAFSVGLNVGSQWAHSSLWVFGAIIVVGLSMALASAARDRAVVEPETSRAGRAWLLLLLWFLLSLALYYWVLLDRATFDPRYICFVAPACWVLLGALVAAAWRGSRLVGAVGSIALLVVLVPAIRSDLSDPAYFREDARGLVTWLKASASPADVILVDQRYPFGFYYPRWSNEHDGTPPAEPEELAPAQYLFVDINHLDERLTSLTMGAKRVFWVQWYKTDTDPRGAVDFLLRKFGDLRSEQGFRGYGVRTYSIPPGTAFQLTGDMEPVGLVFGDSVRLAAWNRGGRAAGAGAALGSAQSASVSPGQPAWVVAQWESLGGATVSTKVSVRLVSSSGQLAGQDDRPLLNDRHLALPYWEAEDAPLNVYIFDVDPAASAGDYLWQIVVYETATLAPVPWRDAAGQLHGEPATLGRIRVEGAAPSHQ